MLYSYKQSGVDVKRADEIIKNVSSKFKLDNFKNFAGIYSNNELFKDCTLISCTDGIGSKIIPLIENNLFKTIAIDLVAMNLNDLITIGAKPLFFLDYIAANNLKSDIIQKTIENLNLVLLNYNCALLGGEISELPDLIKENTFDIVGFLVGYYKKETFLDKNKTKKGDIIIGFTSDGVHANGFSLIRKLYLDKILNKKMFLETLKPTKIYYDLMQNIGSLVKSAANITGGGLYSNIKRSIAPKLDLSLDLDAILKQEIFEFLKTKVQNPYEVFNMGVGFSVIADKNNVNKIIELSKDFNPFILGEVK